MENIVKNKGCCPMMFSAYKKFKNNERYWKYLKEEGRDCLRDN